PPSSTTGQQPTAGATGAGDQNVPPEEHLRQAREALNGIKTTSVPARNRAQFAELRRHLAALETPTATGASSRTTSRTARSAKTDNCCTDVAAIDRIITNLEASDTEP